MSRQPRRSTTKHQKRKRKARVSARMPASAGNGRFAHRQGNDLIRPHCARPPSSGGKAPRPAAVRLRWKRQVEPLPWNRASKITTKAQPPLESPPADAVFYILSRNPAKPRPPSMAGGACVTSVGLRRRSPPLAPMSEGASMGEAGRPQGSPARARPTQPPSPAGKVSRRKP